MKFNEVLEAVDVVMRSGNVALVMGDAGIGKSQLAKELAKKNGMEVITLYGSLIKEGELNEIY